MNRWLIESKANVNIRGKRNHTPLQSCICGTRTSPELLSILIEAKAEINGQLEWSLAMTLGTAILLSTGSASTVASHRLHEIPKWLGAPETIQTENFHPLLLAVIDPLPSVIEIKLLLDMKAQINLATPEQEITPLYAAILSAFQVTSRWNPRSSSSSNISTRIRAIKLLIESQANINEARSLDGATPLHAAIESNNVEIVVLLIESKANVHSLLPNPMIHSNPKDSNIIIHRNDSAVHGCSFWSASSSEGLDQSGSECESNHDFSRF